MQNNPAPESIHAVLIGGGHSHAILLKHLAMNPVVGARVTLISDVTMTPYSGMLPGYLAGTYDYSETHIDLRRLANYASVEFIKARVCQLNPEKQTIQLESHPEISYDLMSINCGSIP